MWIILVILNKVTKPYQNPQYIDVLCVGHFFGAHELKSIKLCRMRCEIEAAGGANDQ
jgi:hypothetical protein